jgi:Tfp pilus assembly PilM family ATPase
MDFLPGILAPKVRFFGLSIDRLNIRAIELDDQKRVRASAEVELPEGAFEDGILIRIDEFADAIKKILLNGKFNTPYVSVCFPEAYAFTRDHTFPSLPTDELSEAVMFQAKDMFPFPESDIYYDWKLVDETAKEKKVTVVAIQKKVLDPIVETFLALGIRPLRFEPDATALARLIALSPTAYAILAEVNKHGSSVTLVQGEKSLFTTVVSYQSEDTGTSYLTNVGKAIADVDQYYGGKGIIEIGKTVVVATGDIATQELATVLTQFIKNPIKLLSTPAGSPAYTKAYASAASLITPPADDRSINVIPSDIQKSYDQQWRREYDIGVVMRIAIALFFICIIPYIGYFMVRADKHAIASEVASLKQRTIAGADVIRNISQLNVQLDSVASLTPLKATPVSAIADAIALVPPGVIVSEWQFDDSKQAFTLSGTADTRVNLLDFRTKLIKSDRFGSVTLPLGYLETDKNIGYSMTFLVKK